MEEMRRRMGGVADSGTRTRFRSGWLPLLLASSALVAACDDGGTAPEDAVRLTVSIVVSSTGPTGMAAASGPALTGFTQADGVHALVLDKVELVVRDVELKRLSHDDCDAVTGADHDACEAFQTGPFLLDVPLDGSVAQILVSDVPPDVYDEIELDIHKPEDETPEDLQFLMQHPGFKGVSIRVEGTFDGESFVFFQDLGEERELHLSPPLVVEEGAGDLNLTLELDLGSWFLRDDSSLIDPRTANKGGPNEDEVEENISASIRAFADPDRDGRED